MENKRMPVQVLFFTGDNGIDGMKKLLIDGKCDTGYDSKKILIVTDDPQMLKELLKLGYYVVGLLDESNHDRYFEGARYVIEDVNVIEPETYEEIYCRLAGLPILVLETDRLLIRESTVEDVDSFYEIYRDPSITYYMENLYQDPDEERAYMKDYIEKVYGFYGYGMWSVILKDTGEVIGRAGLSVREGFEIPELGFVIGKQYQGKGYAFEACSNILLYAKEELQFEQVRALVEPENLPSKKLLKKLGFVCQEFVKMKDIVYEYQIFESEV